MKINNLKVTKCFENDEPQHCEYYGCEEYLNGLNHYRIRLFRHFCFDIWLCYKHAELLEKKIKEKKIML